MAESGKELGLALGEQQVESSSARTPTSPSPRSAEAPQDETQSRERSETTGSILDELQDVSRYSTAQGIEEWKRRKTEVVEGGGVAMQEKRKRDEKLDGDSRLKRSKSDGSHASATNVRKEDQLGAIGASSIQETVVDSLADCESETYGNRVNYCLVTSPAGRPVHEYQSAREILEALRDAIRGHRSLLEDGKILHRDVSENNIIITELPAEDAPKGRLIDLDLAKELDGMPSGVRHRTGTMQFMAIEVLEGKGHTYRQTSSHFLRLRMDVHSIWLRRYGQAKTKQGDETEDKYTARLVYWDIDGNCEYKAGPHGQKSI